MADLEQRLCKLPIEGRNRMCIVKTEWDENNCTIYLLLGNEVWIGNLWEEDALQMSSNLSLPSKEYLNKIKHALTCHGGAANFIYTVDGDKFCWKMRTSSGMSIKYGSVELRSAQVSDVVESIIDSELDTNIQLNEELKSLKKQKEELETVLGGRYLSLPWCWRAALEKLLLSQKLEELCQLKNEMENTLYSKFLLILNEKKKKIRELNEKLKSGEDYEDDDEDDNKKMVRQAVVSDVSDHFGSETDMETDNEMEMSQTDMMFGETKKGKEISPRKLKYGEAHPEGDEGDIAGPSGVKISKPTVKVTNADDSTDCDNEKTDVSNPSKTSQRRNDNDSGNEMKNNSRKSKSVFSQDTQKASYFMDSQNPKDLSPEEILSRLVD